MRDNTKWIMLITVVTFVGLMVFGWGMDITGRSSAATAGGELGRVNGEPVNYQEWLTTYRSLFDQQQRSNPGQPVNATLNRQLENTAWDQIVMSKLVNQELRRRGIEVTESEIRQAARLAPPPEFMSNELFQTNGQFDSNKYYQFLASPTVDNQLLLQLEAYYRDVIPRSKLFYQVTAGTYIPDSELRRIFNDARETVRIRYIAFDPNRLVPDASVSVSDAEVETYYKKNRDQFKRPATSMVRYVLIDRSASAADSAAALERAKQVRAAAASGNFADIAQRESSDSVSARQGGSVGKLRRGRTVPAFEQAAFSLPVGQVSEPVLTQFGYHIIKVESRNDEEADTRHILIPIVPSPEHEERLLERADSLERLGESMPIAEVARRLGLRVREAELSDSTPFLPGVGPADDAAIWVFRDGEIGEVSESFETEQAFYMAEIVSKTEAGVLPLKDAKAEIQQKLMSEKKLAAVKETARSVLDGIRGGESLEQAAQKAGVTVAEAGPFTRGEFIAGIGRANAAVGTAFGLKPGQVSGVVESNGSVFIIQTLEKTSPDAAEFEIQKQDGRARITQAIAEQRWNQFLASLKENAKIVDNRAALQRQSAQATAAPPGFF